MNQSFALLYILASVGFYIHFRKICLFKLPMSKCLKQTGGGRGISFLVGFQKEGDRGIVRKALDVRYLSYQSLGD